MEKQTCADCLSRSVLCSASLPVSETLGHKACLGSPLFLQKQSVFLPEAHSAKPCCRQCPWEREAKTVATAEWKGPSASETVSFFMMALMECVLTPHSSHRRAKLLVPVPYENNNNNNNTSGRERSLMLKVLRAQNWVHGERDLYRSFPTAPTQINRKNITIRLGKKESCPPAEQSTSSSASEQLGLNSSSSF